MATNKKVTASKSTSKSSGKLVKSGGAKKKSGTSVKNSNKVSTKGTGTSKRSSKSSLSTKQGDVRSAVKPKSKRVKVSKSPKSMEKVATASSMKKGGLGRAIKGAVDVVAKKVSEAVSGGPTPKAKVNKKVKVQEKKSEVTPAAKQSVKAQETPTQKQVDLSAKKKGAASPVVGAVAAAVKTTEVPREVILTDADGRRYCRVRECDQIAMVDAYCRYHYLLNWKKIQVRKRILTDGKLRSYLEELTARYPNKYLEMIHRDLRTDDDFIAAINELGIDESGFDSEYEDEAQSYIQEVRGVGDTAGVRDEDDF